MTQHVIIATAATFGVLSVTFGAFGAHALKKILSKEQLHSFEVGVKYQMYHSIVLLVLSFNSNAIRLKYTGALPQELYYSLLVFTA